MHAHAIDRSDEVVKHSGLRREVASGREARVPHLQMACQIAALLQTGPADERVGRHAASRVSLTLSLIPSLLTLLSRTSSPLHPPHLHQPDLTPSPKNFSPKHHPPPTRSTLTPCPFTPALLIPNTHQSSTLHPSPRSSVPHPSPSLIPPRAAHP